MMIRSLICMFAALLALAGQALAKDQKPLQLSSFMKPEVSAGAQAMAYAPETTGALPRIEITPRQKRAAVIGGATWPFLSYIDLLKDELKAKGYQVDVRGPNNWTELDLGEYDLIVGHSMGGRAAYQAPGGSRLIITVDAYLAGAQYCPVGAHCINYFNSGHAWLGFGQVPGAKNIDCLMLAEGCGALSIIPVVGHVTMSLSPQLRRLILAQL